MQATPKTGKPTTRRTGRPAEFVRDDSIEAAMQLFWANGFSAVSTLALADAMSIQRSSFYNSFGERQLVFREALQRYAALAPDAALEQVHPGDPVVPVLVAVLRDICRVRAADTDTRGCLACNSIAELVGKDKTLGPLLERAVKDRVGVVERLLRQATTQGEIDALPDPGAAARSFAAFLIGLNTISKVVRDEGDLWTMCVQFLSGLGIAADRRLRAPATRAARTRPAADRRRLT